MIFNSIRFKLSAFIFLLLIVTAFLLSMLTIETTDQYILNEVIKKSELLSKSTAAAVAYNLVSKDMVGIDHIIFKIKEANKDVEYIALVNKKMVVIAHSALKKRGERLKPVTGNLLRKNKDGTIIREKSGPSAKLFEIETPVLFMKKKIGTLLLGINTAIVMDARIKLRNRILAGFAVTLFLGIAGITFLSSIITLPIKELSSGVQELKTGRKNKALRVYSRDELGTLTEHFNEMSALISEQQERLTGYAHELEEAYVSTVKVLAAAIDARDPYTSGHSTRIAMLSLRLGEKVGLSKKELEDLEIACLFHDVGKLKIPDAILMKEGSLEPIEYREMMQHPEYGAEILSKVLSLHQYIPAVLHHHEWYNGMGYPHGLKGDNIPLFASIISITDSFDAMTSTRPYRKALSETEAINELSAWSGRQFHPGLVEAFVEVINKYLEPLSQAYKKG